ncbi:MAG: ABC transporter permease [Gemmatimonadales bacterium]
MTLAVLGAMFTVVVLVPLGAVLAQVRPGDLALLASARPWTLLGRSLALATAVTTAALAIGVPAGAVFARARIPLRSALSMMHLFPVFVPPFFIALGWFHVFGAQGLLGSPATASLLFGPVGAWAVLALAFTPVVTALTTLGIRSLDSSLEDAARVVASPRRVLAAILVPAVRPQIALAALLVFAISLAELGVPMFLRVDVYAAAVFARLGGVDFAPGEAVALSVPIVAVAMVLTMLERRVSSHANGAALSFRSEARQPLDVGAAAIVVAATAAFLSMVPVVALAAHGAPALSGVATWAGASVQNGLVVSLATAAIAAPMGIALGHGVARDETPAKMMAGGFLFAFFVPSAVLGVGIVSAWNRPATSLLYGSEAVLVLGFLGRYGILAVRAFAASCRQVSRSYEDAAQVAGSGYLGRLFGVVAPMQHRGVVAALGLTFVFCLRDLETAVLFYPAGGEPLTVRIFTLEANGPSRLVAALAVVHVVVTAAVLLVFGGLLRETTK